MPLLASCQKPEANAETPLAAPRLYIALGDSVSTGFSTAPEDRNTTLFFEMLKAEGYVDAYINMAVDGYTSADLLRRLNNMSVEESARFKEASIITVNIGGNNLLTPFIDYILGLGGISDMFTEIADLVSDFGDVFAEVTGLASEARELASNFSILDMLRIGSLINRFTSSIDDVTDIYGRIQDTKLFSVYSLLFGNFPEELEAELDKGLEGFKSDFARISEWIAENAPDAVVIVNTVYNPFPKELLGRQFQISGKAQEFTEAVNSVILNSESGFLISDVHSLFAGAENILSMMNISLDLTRMTFVFDIIHPSETGHLLIAELKHDIFTVYMKEK
jgi:lysophospholipase L1-like esterase